MLTISPLWGVLVLWSVAAAAGPALPPTLEKQTTEVSSSLEARLHRLQMFAEKRIGFSVRFDQTIYSSLRKRTRKENGTLEVMPPNRFRWEVEGKNGELVVSDGTTVWKYSPRARHAQRLPAESEAMRFLDVILSPAALGDRFSLSPWEGGEGKVVSEDPVTSDVPPPKQEGKLQVRLLPKTVEQIEAVMAIIDEKEGFTEELRLVFRSGNRTRIVFSGIQESSFPKDRFLFVPPKGVAVDD